MMSPSRDFSRTSGNEAHSSTMQMRYLLPRNFSMSVMSVAPEIQISDPLANLTVNSVWLHFAPMLGCSSTTFKNSCQRFRFAATRVRPM